MIDASAMKEEKLVKLNVHMHWRQLILGTASLITSFIESQKGFFFYGMITSESI